MKEKKIFKFLIIYLPIIMIILGIGYAAVSDDLTATGNIAMTYQDDIAIININPATNIENYNKTVFTTNLELENASDSKTIAITVKNLGNSKQIFDGILYDPTHQELYSNANIIPNIQGITANTILNSTGNNDDSVTFNMTFSYDDINNITNNSLEGTINLHFTPLRQITYLNCTNSENLTSEYVRSKPYTDMNNNTYSNSITIKDSPQYVIITTESGTELEKDVDYTYVNGVVTFLTELTEDIVIKNNNKAYFMQYDGLTNLMGFSKTGIKSFQRSDMTKAQFESLTGVNIVNIKNVSNDEYNSAYDIYGWVDSNNDFYWWSEADEVYFHPETINAFRDNTDYVTTLITVNLNGTNTSKVRNFSHWFDTDRVLAHIYGAIDTSGLGKVGQNGQLEPDYNDSFNYSTDNNEGPSSGKGLAFMFNDCNALVAIDLTKFNTTNASDMKRMFAGCTNITSLDLSGFDTSNVKSMYWMFRKNQKITDLDLSSFDTSKVENMYGMFLTMNVLKTVKLGANFNTGNVYHFTSMFNGLTKLTTIYAEHDFQIGNSVTSSNMFNNNTALVGGAGTEFETPYDSSHKNHSYAKIAYGQKGYFTKIGAGTKYNITYNLDGGTASNPTYYYSDMMTITLNQPTKTGYAFTGWTGSNGNTPQLTVTIPTGSTGDKSYTAHWIISTYDVIFDANGGSGIMTNQTLSRNENSFLKANTYTRSGYKFVEWNTKADGSGTAYLNKLEVKNLTNNSDITLYAQWIPDASANFNKVFEQVGACTFNGRDTNVTGANCTDYANTNHINTGVRLYDNTNYSQDYEIYFVIDQYSNSAQNNESQQVLMNSKYELSSAGYPGMVFRRSSNASQFEFTQTINGTKVAKNINVSGLSSVRIIRKDGKIYYSLNDGGVMFFQDISGTSQYFNTPVTFGASLENGNENTPYRFIVATLSNMYIKLGTYHE